MLWKLLESVLRWTHKIAVCIGILLYGVAHSLPAQMLNILMLTLLLISLALLEIHRKTRFLFNISFLVLAGISTYILIFSYWAASESRISSSAFFEKIVIAFNLAPNIASTSLPLGSFMLGLILYAKDKNAIHALRGASIFGSIIAILSIIQFTVDDNSLLFGAKHFYLDSLTATFVNRNTAATFLGMTLILILAELTYSSYSQRRNHKATISSKYIFMLIQYFCAIICFSALLLTNSRAGVASTLIAVMVYGVLAYRPSRSIVSPKALIFTVLVALGVGLFVFSGRLGLRLNEWIGSDARFCVAPSVIEMVKDGWPWGLGYGSFLDLFPGYRDPSCGVQYRWSMAHNFYLEGLSSLGLTFILALSIATIALVHTLLHGMRNRKRAIPFVAMGCAICVLCALHAFFDFSLQIPGVAQYFGYLLAASLCLCFRDDPTPRKTSASSEAGQKSGHPTTL